LKERGEDLVKATDSKKDRGDDLVKRRDSEKGRGRRGPPEDLDEMSDLSKGNTMWPMSALKDAVAVALVQV
jgi:hypothetical protein